MREAIRYIFVRSPVYSSNTELTSERALKRNIPEWDCGRTRDRGTCLSRCTWTRAHPPISAADAPRAFNPLSFQGRGEASARLSHRRVSSGSVCVRNCIDDFRESTRLRESREYTRTIECVLFARVKIQPKLYRETH